MESRPIIKLTSEKATSTLIGVNNNGNPISAIVIDDEFTHRRIMSQILRSIGFEILGEAKNGQEGVQMYEQLRPQLVTLDYHMPKMDGLSTLKEIRKMDENAVILMSTSVNNSDTVKELIQNGIADFIVKPFERENLILKLADIVKQHFSSID